MAACRADGGARSFDDRILSIIFIPLTKLLTVPHMEIQPELGDLDRRLEVDRPRTALTGSDINTLWWPNW